MKKLLLILLLSTAGFAQTTFKMMWPVTACLVTGGTATLTSSNTYSASTVPDGTPIAVSGLSLACAPLNGYYSSLGSTSTTIKFASALTIGSTSGQAGNVDDQRFIYFGNPTESTIASHTYRQM